MRHVSRSLSLSLSFDLMWFDLGLWARTDFPPMFAIPLKIASSFVGIKKEALACFLILLNDATALRRA